MRPLRRVGWKNIAHAESANKTPADCKVD